MAEKELETCHAAQEYLLLCMILDKLLKNNEDMINSEGAEIICRRLHGLQLAFAEVRRLSDWKQPKGQAGQKWRSKVQWDLCAQYDVRSLDEQELQIPAADEEVRLRLEKKALFNKHLTKERDTNKEEAS